jgi:Mn2+/Fe2+ NRAMP family transporter
MTPQVAGAPVAGREPAPAPSGNWLRMLRVFGPGAVIASVTVGTGETIFAPRLGAIFAYQVLWIIVIAAVAKGVLVYTGARHLVLTGEHPMQAWTRLPGPRAWFPILLGSVAVLSFPLWVAALSDAVASLCVWMTGVGQGSPSGRPLWSTAIILTAMFLSVIQTYNVVERVSTAFLGLKIFFILVAILVIGPDWRAVLAGFVTPHIPSYGAWVASGYPEIAREPPFFHLAIFLGVIGGGVQDYVGYVGMMREKPWGRGVAWLRAPLVDVVCSFACVLVLTSCFMILGAAVLHPAMQVPIDQDLYSRQSQFLGVVHPSLVAVYKAGIFVAVFGAIYGTFELYGRTAYEPLRAIWPARRWDYSRVRFWIALYSGAGALLVLWTGLKTVAIVKITSPISGVLGCGLWCLAMLWLDRTHAAQPHRMRAGLTTLTVLSGLIMAGIGAYTAFRTWFP